jgi:hypothetical protein
MPRSAAVRHHSHMNNPAPRAEREAATATEVALALAGHELSPFTAELVSKMGRGEITGDQAVEAIVTRFVGDASGDVGE